jgi:hypothetical protein
METSKYFDCTLTSGLKDVLKDALYSEAQESFQKVIREDDNFQLLFIKDKNIRNMPYHKYEIKTKKNSLADECVVGIRINSIDKEEDGQVFYWPKSVKVTWGMSSNPISVDGMIQALTEASKFAQIVSKLIPVRIDD